MDPATIGTAIGLGIPLFISEVLPFISALPGNGILHSIALFLIAMVKAASAPPSTTTTSTQAVPASVKVSPA